jgi:hypothetical protein
VSFDFDLEAAVNAIATLERAITTPEAGITTSYGYNLNPNEVTDPADFPAVVHVHRGPVAPEGGTPEMRLTPGGYYVGYDVESIAMILEIVPTKFPADEGTANLYWKSILETFQSPTNKSSLATDAGATEYRFFLGTPSYGIVTWPPLSPPIHNYWGYTYIHRFLFFGGGT